MISNCIIALIIGLAYNFISFYSIPIQYSLESFAEIKLYEMGQILPHVRGQAL